MKKLLPILSLACTVFLFQSCTNEDQEMMTHNDTHQNIIDEIPISNSKKGDSTKSLNSELYPDPPVKDTHDWKMQP